MTQNENTQSFRYTMYADGDCVDESTLSTREGDFDGLVSVAKAEIECFLGECFMEDPDAMPAVAQIIIRDDIDNEATVTYDLETQEWTVS